MTLIAATDLGRGVAPLGRSCAVAACLLSAAAPDLGREVTPLVAAPDLGRGVIPLVAAPEGSVLVQQFIRSSPNSCNS